jgi:hypothetical protein
MGVICQDFAVPNAALFIEYLLAAAGSPIGRKHIKTVIAPN